MLLSCAKIWLTKDSKLVLMQRTFLLLTGIAPDVVELLQITVTQRHRFTWYFLKSDTVNESVAFISSEDFYWRFIVIFSELPSADPFPLPLKGANVVRYTTVSCPENVTVKLDVRAWVHS